MVKKKEKNPLQPDSFFWHLISKYSVIEDLFLFLNLL